MVFKGYSKSMHSNPLCFWYSIFLYRYSAKYSKVFANAFQSIPKYPNVFEGIRYSNLFSNILRKAKKFTNTFPKYQNTNTEYPPIFFV